MTMDDWRNWALCLLLESDTTRIFFPNEKIQSDIDRAKAICAECEVREDCLEEAIALGEEGIWGGMTEVERRKFETSRVLKASQNASLQRRKQHEQFHPVDAFLAFPAYTSDSTTRIQLVLSPALEEPESYPVVSLGQLVLQLLLKQPCRPQQNSHRDEHEMFHTLQRLLLSSNPASPDTSDPWILEFPEDLAS